MKLNKAFIKEVLFHTLCLILVCAVYYGLTFATGCPIRYRFGISCPGCGMTRAWLSILKGDIRSAISYHPLFWMGPLVAFGIIFGKWINFSKYKWLIGLLIFLYLAVYLIRLFWFPDHIVNIHF